MAAPTTLTDSKWWLVHKGDTVGKTGLTPALKAYAALRKSAGDKFEHQSIDLHNKLVAALDKVNDALEVAFKKTSGLGHKTSHGYIKAYQGLVKKEEAKLRNARVNYGTALKEFEATRRKAVATILEKWKEAKGCLQQAEKVRALVLQPKVPDKQLRDGLVAISDERQAITMILQDIKKQMQVYSKADSSPFAEQDTPFVQALFDSFREALPFTIEAEQKIRNCHTAVHDKIQG